GLEGLVPGDQRIAAELRETGRPVLLAINKTDDKRSLKSALEFYELGFDPVFEISAEHGTGVAELLDEVVERLGARGLGLAETEIASPQSPATERDAASPEPRAATASDADREIRVAIIGRPNVGK